MTEYEKKTSVGRFFASRSFLLVALIIVTLLALGFARAYYQDYRVKREIQQLEYEVSQLEQKKLDSLDMLKYVASPAYVEDKARTELNMKKPGEHVAFLQNMVDEGAEAGDNTDISTDRQSLTNPVKWVYYFIHKELPVAD